MSFSERYSRLLEGVCQLGELQLGVVGEDGVAVLGTGQYRQKIGSIRPIGCHLTRKDGAEQVRLIQEPGFIQDCANCEKLHNCAYSLILCAPIIIGSDHMGNIGLMAQNGQMREQILREQGQWVDYLEKLAGTFSDFSQLVDLLRLRNMTDKALNQTFQIDGNQGLIVVDSDQGILRLNNTAKTILQMSGQEDLTQPLKQVLPEDILRRLLSRDDGAVLRLNERLFNLRRLDSTSPCPNGSVALVIDELSFVGGDLHGSTRKEPPALSRIIGFSPAINNIKAVVSRVAQYTLPILIQGASGTGKELIAKAIHELSPRRTKRLVAFNCSAVPDALFESELFGYERGAFTGASPAGKKGFLELAHEGTLFLDELGELSLANQAKLLRVLEEKEFYRLGGQELVTCDVRIVAATNASLADMMAQKRFREDLYYRLNSVSILLPPLRERQDDIQLLVQHFLMLHDRQRDWSITPQVRRALNDYAWPGNVRELRNAVDYMAAMAGPGPLSEACLPPTIRSAQAEQTTSGTKQGSIETERDALACRRALDTHGRTTWGKRQAATQLGVSLATFYRMLKRYHIE